ncbi:MAG: hypothetical protein ACE14S_12370 [Candidatus Bathyarchaeia archaeon]
MGYRGHRPVNPYARPIRWVKQFHNMRSNRAKRIDESLRAPLAKSAEQNRFDIPDVDVPKKSLQEEQDETWKAERDALSASQPTRSHSLTHIRQNLARHKLYGNTH